MNENVRLRQAAERRIARKVILEGKRHGFAFNVDNGGDEPELPEPVTSTRAVLEAMFATDDELLLFYKDDKYVGCVRFIYGNGNGGLDVISDHTVNLGPVLNPVFDWIDRTN